jgi:hypothetical protein
MSLVELLEPILAGGLERNNFFNGRLLSAEDLRAEQDAERLRQSLIARSVGDGVGWGLAVSAVSASPARVRVRAGFAMNRLGDLLRLAADADVALVRTIPSSPDQAPRFFAECEDLPSSTTSNGLGAYVLTISPTSGFRETAPVSDPNTTAAGRGSCGARFSVEGVRFRLAPVALNALQGIGTDLRSRIAALLPTSGAAAGQRLRNLLAHACFGSPALGGEMNDALELDLGQPGESGWGLLDSMRRRGDLTDCDVPLAVVVLTPSALSFVDMWPARRRLLDAGAISRWQGVASPRRIAEGEAAFLQFQSQLDIVKALGSPATVAANSYFDVLPAGGWLPTGTSGFNWSVFFGSHAPPDVTPVDAALLRGILERSWFDEAFALSTTPPVPIRVFEVPGTSAQPFVVFARSSQGAIRVLLTPPPADTKQIDVTATALTGSVGKSTKRSGGIVQIPELVPGRHLVSITAPEFAAITPRTADVVGGRTVDLTVTLAPIPNGSMVVRPVDVSGASIASAVQTIRATGGGTTFNAVRQGNTWLLANLPPASYAITGSASGFKVATKNAGAVALGQQVEVTLQFEQEKPVVDRPQKCIELSANMKPLPARARLCLVLQAAEFSQEWFYKAHDKGGLGDPDSVGPFRLSNRAGGERAAGRYAIHGSVILYRDPPWQDMERLQIGLPAVQQWLLEWRSWLSKTVGDTTIDGSNPEIYLLKSFRPSTLLSHIPNLPLAYAVFGSIGVPITVQAPDRRTRASIRLDEVEGFPAPSYLEDLAEANILFVDDLVGSWTEFLADATGEPEDVLALLVEEVANRVEHINTKFGYYEGLDEPKRKAMVDAGYGDDVAIANAELDELAEVLGSKFLAARAREKARRIVPEESWSLHYLGLPESQVSGLRAIGVDSMGAFMANTTTTSGKAALAQVLGLGGQAAAARDKALGVVANEAATAIATGSIATAPALSLAKWEGVDAATAGKLVDAGFGSVEAVASADPAALAESTGIAPAAATKLVKDAGTEARSKLTVSLLGADATVAAVIDRTPAEIATEFGGNAARATAVLNGIAAGLARRNPR